MSSKRMGIGQVIKKALMFIGVFTLPVVSVAQKKVPKPPTKKEQEKTAFKREKEAKKEEERLKKEYRKRQSKETRKSMKRNKKKSDRKRKSKGTPFLERWLRKH